MVVPRKPTPMGLELHTVCCAVSGILINFELYEGKERMEKKQYVGEPTEFGPINKSTALTLRCVQPWVASSSRIAGLTPWPARSSCSATASFAS
eukprot:5900924-Pleurochrysis_carterae.AAC.1